MGGGAGGGRFTTCRWDRTTANREDKLDCKDIEPARRPLPPTPQDAVHKAHAMY